MAVIGTKCPFNRDTDHGGYQVSSRRFESKLSLSEILSPYAECLQVGDTRPRKDIFALRQKCTLSSSAAVWTSSSAVHVKAPPSGARSCFLRF